MFLIQVLNILTAPQKELRNGCAIIEKLSSKVLKNAKHPKKC